MRTTTTPSRADDPLDFLKRIFKRLYWKPGFPGGAKLISPPPKLGGSKPITRRAAQRMKVTYVRRASGASGSCETPSAPHPEPLRPPGAFLLPPTHTG